jgi:histidinol-phosphate/aromatic aminotransferase/cobyric acid decarboxylase-like protein
VPYPVPSLSAEAFTALTGAAAMALLLRTAADACKTEAPFVALAGAQAAIQLVPHLRAPGLARIVAPTYNEHGATLRALGWQVEEVLTLEALAGANIGIVVNPNNPDGRRWRRADLLAMLTEVGFLVVDESFADPFPQDSLAGDAGARAFWCCAVSASSTGWRACAWALRRGSARTSTGWRTCRGRGRCPARQSRWPARRWRIGTDPPERSGG